MNYEKALVGTVKNIIGNGKEWEYHEIYNPNGFKPSLITRVLRFFK